MLELLLYFFIFITLVGVGLIVACFLAKKPRTVFTLLIVMMLFTLLVNLLGLTALPSNYIAQRVSSGVLAGVSFVSIPILCKVFSHKLVIAKIAAAVFMIIAIAVMVF